MSSSISWDSCYLRRNHPTANSSSPRSPNHLRCRRVRVQGSSSASLRRHPPDRSSESLTNRWAAAMNDWNSGVTVMVHCWASARRPTCSWVVARWSRIRAPEDSRLWLQASWLAALPLVADSLPLCSAGRERRPQLPQSHPRDYSAWLSRSRCYHQTPLLLSHFYLSQSFTRDVARMAMAKVYSSWLSSPTAEISTNFLNDRNALCVTFAKCSDHPKCVSYGAVAFTGQTHKDNFSFSLICHFKNISAVKLSHILCGVEGLFLKFLFVRVSSTSPGPKSSQNKNVSRAIIFQCTFGEARESFATHQSPFLIYARQTTTKSPTQSTFNYTLMRL